MCTYIGHLESYNIVGNDKEVSYACCLRGQRSIDVPPKQSNMSEETKSTYLGNIIGFVGMAKGTAWRMNPTEEGSPPFSSTVSL
jgi:hypothetical protein